MLIEAMLGVKEAVSFGVTLYDGYQTAPSAITGNTVTRRLERLDATLNRIADHLATSPVREVEHHAGPRAPMVEVTPDLSRQMQGVQRGFGLDLVQSQAIEPPAPLLGVFRENPESLLVGIRPLEGADIAPEFLDDPHYVPVVFEKWNTRFVGWIRSGVLTATLGTDYRPKLAERVAGAPAPQPAPPPRLSLAERLHLTTLGLVRAQRKGRVGGGAVRDLPTLVGLLDLSGISIGERDALDKAFREYSTGETGPRPTRSEMCLYARIVAARAAYRLGKPNPLAGVSDTAIMATWSPKTVTRWGAIFAYQRRTGVGLSENKMSRQG